METKHSSNLENHSKTIQNRNSFHPYIEKCIIIASIILFLIIVGFVGFAFGAKTICNQVQGFLDHRFTCHLDYNEFGRPKNWTPQIQDPTFDIIDIGNFTFDLQ